MKNKYFLPLVMLVASLQLPMIAFGWGATGHQIVVETALSRLKPATKQKVMAVLNGFPADSAAIWMDLVRRHNPWGYMDNWHFVNIEKNQTYAQVKSKNDVEMIAKNIRSLLSAEFNLGNKKIFITVSIGISLFPVDGDDSETMVKHADSAMYSVKTTGKNGYQFYSTT